jgi:hypothetical protein
LTLGLKVGDLGFAGEGGEWEWTFFFLGDGEARGGVWLCWGRGEYDFVGKKTEFVGLNQCASPVRCMSILGPNKPNQFGMHTREDELIRLFSKLSFKKLIIFWI